MASRISRRRAWNTKSGPPGPVDSRLMKAPTRGAQRLCALKPCAPCSLTPKPADLNRACAIINRMQLLHPRASSDAYGMAAQLALQACQVIHSCAAMRKCFDLEGITVM